MIIDLESQPDFEQQFLELPNRVYEGDPHFVATPLPVQAAGLHRSRFAGRQRAFAAVENGHCVARVLARCSPTLTDPDGRPYGMLGFFEALDEPRAVAELLEEAVRWLRQAGAARIIGPIDGDTWHRYRFNVGPFDQPPFLLEPYNKHYYPGVWRSCGFERIERYHSKIMDDLGATVEALDRKPAARYELRPMRMEHFREELELLYGLSRRIFAGNFLYDDIPLKDFLQLYEGIRPLIDSRLVWFAATPEGEAAGFAFACAHHGTALVKSIGVLDEHRGCGLGVALALRAYRSGLEMGLGKGGLCLMRDGNPSSRLDGGTGRIMRRYELYGYAKAA